MTRSFGLLTDDQNSNFKCPLWCSKTLNLFGKFETSRTQFSARQLLHEFLSQWILLSFSKTKKFFFFFLFSDANIFILKYLICKAICLSKYRILLHYRYAIKNRRTSHDGKTYIQGCIIGKLVVWYKCKKTWNLGGKSWKFQGKIQILDIF